MRFDKEGNWHTLDGDIFTIWKEHGLEVIEETVNAEASVIVWTIKAKRIKDYIPKVPS